MIRSAVLLGSGIWMLHLVAVSAYLSGPASAYEAGPICSSLLMAIAGSASALLWWKRMNRRISASIVGGTILGCTIVAVDLASFGRLRGFGPLHLETPILAVALPVGFGIVALLRARDLSTTARRCEVAFWLVCAICGTLFSGMPGYLPFLGVAPGGNDPGGETSNVPLAFGVACLASATTLMFTTMLRRHMAPDGHDDEAGSHIHADPAAEVLLIACEGVVLDTNCAGTRMFGLPRDRIVGMSVGDLIGEDVAKSETSLRRPRHGGGAGSAEIDESHGRSTLVEIHRRNVLYAGRSATAIVLQDPGGGSDGRVHVRSHAFRDALRDLPDRHVLGERLDLALDLARKRRTGLAVIHVDLDLSASVNEPHGHAIADALMVQASLRLQAELEPGDELARIDGHEFVAVAMRAETPDIVSGLAARLVASLERPFDLDGRSIAIAASVGIAIHPTNGASRETLLRAANTALRRVQGSGRSGFSFFEAEIDEALLSRRRLENELGSAIERNELELHYQPIVNARTGAVEAFEALIRWRHPERGYISPVEFIPIAEQSGQISWIGEWVVNTACSTAAAWPQPWRIAINVSPRQFLDSDIADIVARALSGSGLPPERLVVEITEGVFIDNGPEAVRLLEQLRALGVRLALDDFGTGYSSLSYLQRFRFDKIKIDRSFVRTLCVCPDTLTIVRAIINLGHNLGLQVTVEGVETSEQMEILRGLDCDFMQGYLFGRPAPIPTVQRSDPFDT